ncbi:MAG: C39 family peptidase [Clostridiaceae bacterium]
MFKTRDTKHSILLKAIIFLITTAFLILQLISTNVVVAAPIVNKINNDSIEVKTMFHPQEEGPYCGPASLQMVLGAHGIYSLIDGTPINQDLLANPVFLNTSNLNYSSGIDICNTLNDMMGEEIYKYELVDKNISENLESTVFESISNKKVPIFALWQPNYSHHRLLGYPFGDYELRHFVPITGLVKNTSKETNAVLYRDPVYSFSSKFKTEPMPLKINSETLMDLNVGGSRIH